VNYGLTVLIMWLLLTVWVIWNLARYGRRERRNVRPRHVSNADMGRTMGLTTKVIERLRERKTIALHFESENRPVIDAAN